MAWVPCPLCNTRNPGGAVRCSSCGAAFDDPDVRALAGEAAAVSSSSLAEAGALSASRFLSFSLDAAAEGAVAKRLVAVGTAVLAAGFLAPLTVDYAHLVPVWSLIGGGGASLVLLFPVVAIALGLVIAFAPLPGRARSAALVAVGLAGIATLPYHGRFSGGPLAAWTPFLFVMPLAGAAIAFRLWAPTSRAARASVIAAGLLVAVSLFVPVPHGERLLPVEMMWFGVIPHGTKSLFSVYNGIESGVPLLFLAPLSCFLPLGLMALAGALAWPPARGVWDTRGKLLRAVGWFVVLYLPLTYLLFALHQLGMEDAGYVQIGEYVARYANLVKTTMVARAKLAALAGAYSLWIAIGGLAILARPGRSARTG
jgi:hypothetical protein